MDPKISEIFALMFLLVDLAEKEVTKLSPGGKIKHELYSNGEVDPHISHFYFFYAHEVQEKLLEEKIHNPLFILLFNIFQDDSGQMIFSLKTEHPKLAQTRLDIPRLEFILRPLVEKHGYVFHFNNPSDPSL